MAETDIVLFGASGDLAGRKVLPALGGLVRKGALSPQTRILGAGRSEVSDDQFRSRVAESTGSDELARAAAWAKLDYGDSTTFAGLGETLGASRSSIFYLATPPQAFEAIVRSLGEVGLGRHGDHSRRIVLEKPLGHDLLSARAINVELDQVFAEEEVFRIDHYLAKDTVQNTLALRFSNSIFEPIWNRTLIQSIQITVAEDMGVGGRAGYYDQAGAVRDMVQNHVLQVLALVTMEPPITFEAADIRNAKLEALRAVQPIDPQQAVRGQYLGYLDENGVSRNSRRETYVAARLSAESWRWEGIPILIRTGKALHRRGTEVIVRFREAPHLRLNGRRQAGLPTLLVIRVQPDEGITIRIGAKRPGGGFEIVPAGLRLEYAGLAREPLPDAYENVLSEVLAGEHGVFPSAAEIERCWEIVEPLLRAWEADGHPEPYAPGTWGPPAAEELVAAGGGGRWINAGDEPGT
ncbi:MAG: glucose-6-phosphate dehydrogenase [Candidatus Dormibacteraceae bacterium]